MCSFCHHLQLLPLYCQCCWSLQLPCPSPRPLHHHSAWRPLLITNLVIVQQIHPCPRRPFCHHPAWWPSHLRLTSRVSLSTNLLIVQQIPLIQATEQVLLSPKNRYSSPIIHCMWCISFFIHLTLKLIQRVSRTHR